MLEDSRHGYDASDGTTIDPRKISENLSARTRPRCPRRAGYYVRARSLDLHPANSFGAAHGTSTTQKGPAAAADHCPTSPAQGCSEGERSRSQSIAGRDGTHLSCS